MSNPPNVPRSFVEAVRLRPGMYVGSTDSYGLHHLLYFLLDGAFVLARRGECARLEVTLGAGGGTVITDDGPIIDPASLVDVATTDTALIRGTSSAPDGDLWSRAFWLPVVCALSEHFELQSWDSGRQWRLAAAQGRLTAGLIEADASSSMTAFGSRGTRIEFQRDASIFEVLDYEPELVRSRCQQLAFLAPGLRVGFHSAEGVEELFHYPGGVAQRVLELTQARPRLHPLPLACDVEWEGLRVRAALQWTDSQGELHSFANSVRTRKHGRHVDGVFLALRQALATVSGEKRSNLLRSKLERGLFAIIAVEGPNSRMKYQGPTKDLLAIEGLDAAVAEALTPRFIDVLRETQLAAQLVSMARAVE